MIYEVVDLDAWMEEGKRRFTAEVVEDGGRTATDEHQRVSQDSSGVML